MSSGVKGREARERHIKVVLEKLDTIKDWGYHYRQLRKTWYVFEMNCHKKQIPEHVKARQKEAFEEAVLAFATHIRRTRASTRKRKIRHDPV